MKRSVADWEDGSSSDGGSSTVVVCSTTTTTTTTTTTVGMRNLVVVVYHSNNSSNDTIKISNIYSLKISNIYYLLILFIFVHSYYIAISDQPAGVEVERVVLTCKWNVYGYIYIIIIASIST